MSREFVPVALPRRARRPGWPAPRLQREGPAPASGVAVHRAPGPLSSGLDVGGAALRLPDRGPVGSTSSEPQRGPLPVLPAAIWSTAGCCDKEDGRIRSSADVRMQSTRCARATGPTRPGEQPSSQPARAAGLPSPWSSTPSDHSPSWKEWSPSSSSDSPSSDRPSWACVYSSSPRASPRRWDHNPPQRRGPGRRFPARSQQRAVRGLYRPPRRVEPLRPMTNPC